MMMMMMMIREKLDIEALFCTQIRFKLFFHFFYLLLIL